MTLVTLYAPFLAAFVFSTVPARFSLFIRAGMIWAAAAEFLLAFALFLCYNTNVSLIQQVTWLDWHIFINFYYAVGLDALSLSFVLLTNFLLLIIFLLAWKSQAFLKQYVISFFLVQGFLLQTFCVLDVSLFYIFFEATLIPLFLIVGFWGSREQKFYASYLLFLYTLLGSLPLLVGILLVLIQTNSSDFSTLWFVIFSEQRQVVLWILFFVGFAIKVPLFPFHAWLPEAHTEAPTGGSILLAGVLLKLGGYGLIRFSLLLFPFASVFFVPYVFLCSCFAVLYGSWITLRQSDLKAIIAYSSVVHMSYVTAGLFVNNYFGLLGAICLMLAHGFSSSGLFFAIGLLYERFKTRSLKYYGGNFQTMPLWSLCFAFLTFSNIGFPGTVNFIAELLVLIGCAQLNIFFCCLLLTNVLLSACYSIWLLNRLCFGVFKFSYFKRSQDLTRREGVLMAMIIAPIFGFGLSPHSLFTLFYNYVCHLLIL